MVGCGDGGAHEAVLPGQGVTLVVEATFKHVQRGRAVAVMLEIVGPGPLYFHGHTGGLGAFHRVQDEIGHGAPAEATAGQGDLDLDLLGLQARDLLDGGNRPGRSLGRGPDLASARLHIRHGHHGLHGGVGQEGRVVGGLDPLGGGGQG